MKFGKYILSQQISGWGAYYLDYKFLKKIINSLEKGRLADAALFATGVRPEYSANGQSTVSPQPQILPNIEGSDELQIHKAAFFFKLERELEKINNFYLQKEAELKSRLQTLIDKKRIIFESRNSSKLSKESPSYVALYEGFRYFEKDLSKLQQFIEINATGFRKILKKWDKRSKSQTKELYLARQVEVQPCFNLKFIAELSDIAAANLLELENLSHGRSLNETLSTSGASLSSENRLDFAAAQSQDFDALADLEANLAHAVKAGRVGPATEMIRIAAQNEDPISVSRIVWRALLEAPHEAVRAALEHHLADYKFIDDISSRTCLHESSMAGKLYLVQCCIENGVDVAQQDIYGRTALSYAAMAGHTDVCKYLLSLPSISAATYDLDGFSPLILAVMNGRTDAVRILLDHGASVEPRDATDLIPLCLASSGGHAEIVRLLLQKGAKIVSNAEGLYPQALAARAGHADCVRLLVESGGDPNAPEKGTQWTPTFFAAESGHVDCLKVLLDAGCDVNIFDEKDRTAAFYAAWNGKIACLLLLLKAAQQSTAAPPARRPSKASVAKASASNDAADDLDLEMDGIPDLSLPPPIIPFRTYGHNYLDKRALVSVSLTNSSVKLYKHQDPNRPEQFSTSSLKLVMTSRPDASTTAIPHNVVLPLADEREVFSFQVNSLEAFTIEWELMPTFGSKVIGKGVALPSSFEGMTDRKRFVLPLQDVYLKVVGEVSFELDFVKPFDSVQLEIGGRVETYWKSMLPGVASASTVGPTRMTPNSGVSGIGGSLSSAAAAAGISTPQGADKGTASGGASGTPLASSAGAASVAAAQPTLVTGSSLAGEYLRVVVQVTKDAKAIVWPSPFIPLAGLQVYVGSVRSDELISLAISSGHSLDWTCSQAAQASWTDWQQALRTSVVTLEKLLSLLPVSVGIDIDVMYPSTAEVRSNPGMPKMEVNQFVDTILHTVYAAGTSNREQSRKIVFSSRSPTVCTALNWKQPNYAVFFASFCGIDGTASLEQGKLLPSTRHETDPRRESISEAVRFAKSNNLLGIMVDVALLNHVPHLVESVKASGLLLITIGKFNERVEKGRARAEDGGERADVDGEVDQGIVVCKS
ncbi:probable PHO81 - cyclin-dependent kinase inhibitor [Melanopsichium pennsylvanicum]|uniref:Probable PHO81 - cyclin-dependent kinase inhibitor n=2 Tax=Melanopsichium pennsylvanicum TaxID=63383 RepID=A0AAJ4XLA3_9BASI|nr:probable PHO81-cyclin-dependent kinase inhibitor [Melanopsichium pennsylvanicum 4]SNX83846.1 probable PHO81 - cyclin-dependent kinase inhibitor [Melanopsichium pennsylvanicum]